MRSVRILNTLCRSTLDGTVSVFLNHFFIPVNFYDFVISLLFCLLKFLCHWEGNTAQLIYNRVYLTNTIDSEIGKD